MTSALERLATAHGIALEYHDVWGKLHRVPERTQRALLGAMGVAADGDESVERALAAHEHARDREIVPRVVVVREHLKPWKLNVRVPARYATDVLGWRVAHEGVDILDELARPSATYQNAPRDAVGDEARVSCQVTLDADLQPGYHALEIVCGDAVVARTCLAVAPAACYRRAADETHRAWGAVAQLYAARSARNWGIGDFSDLAMIVGQWGRRGASVVGVNPLHALFPHDPARISPYSPSSRLFRNILYLDVEAIPDYHDADAVRERVRAPAFQVELARLRDAPLIDHVGVAAAKRPILEMLFTHFRHAHLDGDTARARAFRAFVAEGGEALHRHVLFEALQEHFYADDASIWGWPVWPEAFRAPTSPEVARFAAEHGERLDFFAWLQWQADLQLAAVAARATEVGLEIGLYTDLAVSVDRSGAEAWANQDLYAVSASVGAPPDMFNMKGQDWGLPPLVPERLRSSGYAPFIATLRANMRHAGALRIDHVMGLQRLYWVASGDSAADGAYVNYPLDDLLALLSLESHRHRCVIIGEDLGTVPDSIRQGLARNDVLSYRVLFFERDDSNGFKPPAAYPERALASVSTHDLPTLAGWWEGEDIRVREELGLFPSPNDAAAQRRERSDDRSRLLAALREAGMLPADVPLDSDVLPAMTTGLACAIHGYLAVSPCAVLVMQLEDVLGERAQANLPGTTEAHPNWRRKLGLPLERWPDDGRFLALTSEVARRRPAARKPRAARKSTTPLHVPRATYRLQLHKDFTFADATALVPYLDALGISHVYCSPYLRARPGSRHGYDIVDHEMLNPEIGSRADFERFVDVLAQHGMGHICDVVPNHMGVMGADNAWWMDVLEHGNASPHAEFFDIDWAPIDPEMTGKVLLPVLGDAYGAVLDRGELVLVHEPDTGSFAVRYFEHRFPVDPREYPRILERTLHQLQPDDDATADELVALRDEFSALAARTEADGNRRALRVRASVLLKTRLASAVASRPSLADAIERAVHDINGTPGAADSFEALHQLLEAQAYRLASWRVASDDINYRRFFDVNDLAALRMESPAVFDATHRLVIALAAAGKIDGLRIDHPDGLFDPARYFERLQSRYREARIRSGLHEGDPRSAGDDERPLYVVLEKIAATHERYPGTWPVSGSTGYRFANLVNGVFVDTKARSRVDRAWRAFVGPEAGEFEPIAQDAKRHIMRRSLASELTVLTHRALRVARADRATRDFTFNVLREAIAEVVARFPVYRTYVSGDGASAQDKRYIDWAVTQAKRDSRAADPSVFEFIHGLLLAAAPEDEGDELGVRRLDFAMHFQQFTAPVTAKGVEDTSFYRFNRLVSLNDVGGDPSQFGTTVRAFHGAALDRLATRPATMLASSTHDNKRSEDVRARIDVISELPAAWRLTVRRWSRLNRRHKRDVSGVPAPARNDEYLLYQTLVGTCPPEEADEERLAGYRERIGAYMLKAAREAKVHTSWLKGDAEYEAALGGFIDALLASGTNRFLDELRAQSVAFAWYGMLNSLSMTLLKLTSPGVPDIYQGNEVFDLSLVDPDNRRPVDYQRRRELLDSLDAVATSPDAGLAAAVHELFATPYDGRVKLWVVRQALRSRRERCALFESGDYTALTVKGEHSDHVVAFARRHEGDVAIVVAARMFASLVNEPGALPLGAAVWGDTTLSLDVLAPGTKLVNVLTGESLEAGKQVALANLFAHFPAALLHQRDAR